MRGFRRCVQSSMRWCLEVVGERKMRTNIWGASNTCREISFSPQSLIQFSQQSYEVWIIISKLNMVKLSSREGNSPKIIAVRGQRQDLKPCLCGITIYALFVESPTSSSISVIEYIYNNWTTNHSPILLPFWMWFWADCSLVLWGRSGVVRSQVNTPLWGQKGLISQRGHSAKEKGTDPEMDPEIFYKQNGEDKLTHSAYEVKGSWALRNDSSDLGVRWRKVQPTNI